MSQRLTALSKFLPNPTKLGVVAASFSGGGPRPGAELGPGSLLDYGLSKHLQAGFDGVRITDCLPHATATDKDVDRQIGMNRTVSVSHFTERLNREVYAHARQGQPVLTLGGDHSIAIGTLTGMARAVRERLMGQEIAVIYVDAHADINTPETSPSGNIHGMPLAFATGIARRAEGPLSWISNEHLINPKKIVYLGLRDVEEAEWRTIHGHGIKAFDMREIREKGIERIMDLTLEYIGNETPIHISYDIDGLDPKWAPCTTLPVGGGLSLAEGTYISRRILETGSLVGMDLVELNPSVSPEKLDLTLQTGCSLIYSAFGVEEG
ncbi:arginase [Aspergillus terreus]|uniref:Arginase n=1 Tax=Aspergillus terreus TaxID=33178 RepID=A0A5M3ZEQ1_ASPTE|nr:hypothetical protein ATETN484_0013016300 [Aspergillus terreus]GFF20397.1 arginase [Aspergillus terreus]